MYSRDDYINPKTDGKLSWKSFSSWTYDSGEALENWKNQMHEVSMRRCTRITQYVCQVGVEGSELPTY